MIRTAAVEVAEKRARPDERVEILRVADVPRVHDDEPPGQPVLARPWVVAGHRVNARHVHPVRYHTNPLGPDTFLLEPLPHRVPDRNNPVGRAQRRVDQHTEHADDHRVAEAAELDRNLGKTSWAITSSGTRNRAATTRAIAAMNGGSVMQITRPGRRANMPFHITPTT
jgi:hypothetical protein